MSLPIMITGGCGFIGSNFIRYILETDPTVSILNFDSLTYAGNLANLADLTRHPRYRFVHGDICDREAVHRTVKEGVAGILHFAAESHVDRSIHDSGPFVRTNVLGTQTLLDAARAYKVPRYLQVSTDEVYGSLGATGFFTEETPLAPQQPVCRKQGGGGFAGAKLCAYLRPAGGHHTLLQQLWAVPVSRKIDPAVHSQLARGQDRASLWRWHECARLDSCARSLHRHRFGLAAWSGR